MSMPFSSVYSGGGSTYKREIVRNSVYEKPMNVPKLSCTTTNSPPFAFALLSVVAKLLMFFSPYLPYYNTRRVYFVRFKCSERGTGNVT